MLSVLWLHSGVVEGHQYMQGMVFIISIYVQLLFVQECIY